MGNISTKLKIVSETSISTYKEKKYYKKMLTIPYFSSNFKTKKNFDDILEILKSTYDGILIKDGKILYNHDINLNLTDKLPCYILIWDSDTRIFSRGLGFYVGSGVIITAKHVLQKGKNKKAFVLFPNKKFCLAYNINTNNIVFDNYHDIARVKLEINCDKPPNIKPVEIDLLYENKNLYFYKLKAGHFVKVKCKKTEAVIEKLNPKEFTLSKTGNYGDSGTPIFTSSGKCVGIYIGAFENESGPSNQNKKIILGISLQFNSSLIKDIFSN